MRHENQPIKSCTLVLFGAGGDLSNRKLIPSLYNLARDKLLPEHFALIGNGRREMSDEHFREQTLEALKKQIEGQLDLPVAKALTAKFFYLSGDSTQDQLYQKLQESLKKVCEETKCGDNVIFYLATPPQLFSVVPAKLSQFGFLKESEDHFRRVIFEKPFGHDLSSAKELNRSLSQLVSERQIYRIDHYLGKETVQNIMALRFANNIFEPLWNQHYIDSIQFTVSETLGVEDRGGYYDHAGALRDMVPNHLLQLVSLIGMEAPNSFDSDDVLDEKVKLIKAIRPFSPWSAIHSTVRGQYAGYRNEPNVDPNSDTETYIAMKLEIDNWRWAGVPFFLRTGKKLSDHDTEIVIQFRHVPVQMFKDTVGSGLIDPNLLTFQLYPKEQITLSFAAKMPGTKMRLTDVGMQFDYENTFGSNPRTGYETLLFDAIIGDRTLFQRADQVEASWHVVQPILDAWDNSQSPTFPNYAVGTNGPQEAQALLARDGRYWRERELPEFQKRLINGKAA
jgi:glucose-6-phosphate 1-dehydrogenase